MEKTIDAIEVQIGVLVAEVVRVVLESKLDMQAGTAALDIAKVMLKKMAASGLEAGSEIEFVGGTFVMPADQSRNDTFSSSGVGERQIGDSESKLLH